MATSTETTEARRALSWTYQRKLPKYPRPALKYFYLVIVILSGIMIYFEAYAAGGVAPILLPNLHMSLPFYSYLIVVAGIIGVVASYFGSFGNGWRVAMTTLGNERGGRAAIAHLSYEREFWDLVEVARKHGRTRDPLIRQRLAWAYQQVELMRYSGLRLLATLANQREPGPEASISKLQWSEYHRRFGELAVDILGASMLAGEDVAVGGTAGEGGGALGRWHEVLLLSRAGTIYSGTSEIQRNVIAERALGLPKDQQLG